MLDNSYHQRTLSKIVENPKALRDILENDSHYSRTIVFVKGVYDLFHCGHYYSFVNAREHGDVLVVAVSSDIAVSLRKGYDRPIINQKERMILIAALSCVDWVTLYDDVSPYEVLKILQPDIFVASHFDSLSVSQREDIQQSTRLQVVSKLGENSTSKIIRKVKGDTKCEN